MDRRIVVLLALGALAFLALRSRSAQAAVYYPSQPYQPAPLPTQQASVNWWDYADDIWNVVSDVGDIFDWPSGTEAPTYPDYTPPQTTPDYDWGTDYYGWEADTPPESASVDIWEFPYEPYVPTPTPQPSYSYSVTVPQEYQSAIADAANQYGVPPDTLARLLYQESAFRPDVIFCQTLSSTGAMGIAQFMPATAQEVANKIGAFDPCQPIPSIYAAAYYLKWCLLTVGSGKWIDAVAAYNWGVGNVINYLRNGGAIPQETVQYTAFIIGTPYGTTTYAGTTSTIGIRG